MYVEHNTKVPTERLCTTPYIIPTEPIPCLVTVTGSVLITSSRFGRMKIAVSIFIFWQWSRPSVSLEASNDLPTLVLLEWTIWRREANECHFGGPQRVFYRVISRGSAWKLPTTSFQFIGRLLLLQTIFLNCLQAPRMPLLLLEWTIWWWEGKTRHFGVHIMFCRVISRDSMWKWPYSLHKYVQDHYYIINLVS